MHYWGILLLSVLLNTQQVSGQQADNLPNILSKAQGDLLFTRLRNEAVCQYNNKQLPGTMDAWLRFKQHLRTQIIAKSGTVIYKQLDFKLNETRMVKRDGYTIKNIAFQTQPGIFATANLMIPDGKGPFPAVLVMCGHSDNGRLYDRYQEVAVSLALHGYVSMIIDPWGAGERTTHPGEFEYHGANLGASLMNVGRSLLGMQLSDNMRAIDFLCSLPYVDTTKIGATGASGGGNQTMWLTALDERIKAAVPVVSVGTFESYVMRSNCVCELLIDGLTFTEEAAVLGMIAPRALKMCNARVDNPSFAPEEMQRSYENAKQVFAMYDCADNLKYEVFDLPHGYFQPERETMLGWFDLHLKRIGNGKAVTETSFTIAPVDTILVRQPGIDINIESTAGFCRKEGRRLVDECLRNSSETRNQKIAGLYKMLKLDPLPVIKTVHTYEKQDDWERHAIETTDRRLIPILLRKPGAGHKFTLIINVEGKSHISKTVVDSITQRGEGICILNVSGIDESASPVSDASDAIARFHTLARAELWLGKLMIGEWTNQIRLVTSYLNRSHGASSIAIDCNKEAAIAALSAGAIDSKIQHFVLRNCPISYVFDDRAGINYFSMAVHIPAFLKWGDVPLLAALNKGRIDFIQPVTISGNAAPAAAISFFKKSVSVFDKKWKVQNRYLKFWD